MNTYILLFLIIIVLMLLYFQNDLEGYVNIYEQDLSDVKGKRYGIDILHAKLNHFGGVDSVDKYPPHWRGFYSCKPVPCPENPVPHYIKQTDKCSPYPQPPNPKPVPYPEYVKSNEEIVCWQCPSIKYYPQYN